MSKMCTTSSHNHFLKSVQIRPNSGILLVAENSSFYSEIQRSLTVRLCENQIIKCLHIIRLLCNKGESLENKRDCTFLSCFPYSVELNYNFSGSVVNLSESQYTRLKVKLSDTGGRGGSSVDHLYKLVHFWYSFQHYSPTSTGAWRWLGRGDFRRAASLLSPLKISSII